MATRKIAPALAAGCTVILKPASETPLTALLVAQILEDAGVPPGVVNVLPSRSSGAIVSAMLHDPRVRKISFTGSTEVGRILLREAADNVVNASMELGGNAPFIVFDDADLGAAIDGAMVAKMRHSAETCTAANRFFAEAPVAAEFTERLAAAMAGVKVGNGLDDGVTCGPMINAAAIESIDGLVKAAIGAGASAAVGGHVIEGPGWFYEPTVLADVDPTSAITREEIFGPVAPVIPFTDSDIMISQANDTEMGLTAYVYTADLARGLAVSERLESGMVGLNRGAVSDPAAPFGGMKQSGLGREGASEGIYEFCETQYIAASW
jgi:succinate-semialdehyde dehydrogenase/glutarate-semialdehyde dehydrogenase